MSDPSEVRRTSSTVRILAIVLPVAAVGAVAYWWALKAEETARGQIPNMVFAVILRDKLVAANAEMDYPDTDGDLLADSPSEPDKCIAPDKLVFSYAAGAADAVPEEKWRELLATIREKTGREVEYASYESAADALQALKQGKLHIVGLNTGVVPAAVRSSGFVPICTFGHDDGSYGYTMKILVPADSPIKSPADLRGHKVVLTQPDSNSGCKALLVMLKNQFDMLPDRDYGWGFSLAHETSIRGVSDKTYEAAPIASDVLARMVEKGDVDKDAVRSVYESERFPPATIGIAYNLTPELRDSIRAALVGFQLPGTGIEGEFGADVTKLVAVSYKDDWANTRRIDQAIADSQQLR